MTAADLQEFFSGKKLWGDDFGPDEIKAWYDDEKEGYASLESADNEGGSYMYDMVNHVHGFSKKKLSNARALGLGSAYGDEFKSILSQLKSITILDPSDKFAAHHLQNVPVTYRKPEVSGDILMDKDSFDMVVSFGVLHHIPNVSHVVSEIGRVLESGGVFFLREPIISMGDWRQPRKGLTRRERGIPPQVLKDILHRAGFRIVSAHYCFSPVAMRLARLGNPNLYFKKWFVYLDWLMASAGSILFRYHRTKKWQHLGPTNTFIVAVKK